MQALESLNEQQVREIYNFLGSYNGQSGQSPDPSLSRNLSSFVVAAFKCK